MNNAEHFDYAWRYFEMHAGQRMTTFNFFVVLAALLTTGLAATFEKESEVHYIGAGIGLSLIIVSIVFWKLDQRVRFLIHHAEDVLKEMERIAVNDDQSFPLLFLEEHMKTNKKSCGVFRGIIFHHFKYTLCFGMIYLLFGLLGLVGMSLSLVEKL